MPPPKTQYFRRQITIWRLPDGEDMHPKFIEVEIIIVSERIFDYNRVWGAIEHLNGIVFVESEKHKKGQIENGNFAVILRPFDFKGIHQFIKGNIAKRIGLETITPLESYRLKIGRKTVCQEWSIED